MKPRSTQLNIRISSADKAALQAAAQRHGYRGVGDYLRAIAISGKAPVEYLYTVKIHPGDADEGGFWSEVPALPGCNSQGESYEETLQNTTKAIEGYLRMLSKLGEPIPGEKQPRKTVVATVKVAV